MARLLLCRKQDEEQEPSTSHMERLWTSDILLMHPQVGNRLQLDGLSRQ